MTKRKTIDLAGAVHGAAQSAAVTPAPTTTSTPRPGRGPSRRGKHGILIHVEPELAAGPAAEAPGRRARH